MIKSIAIIVLSGLVAGCAHFEEKYQRPAVSAPGARLGGSGSPAAWPDRQWWKQFGSSELDALILEAQNNNHDLKAAAARVTQARAAARIAGALQYPTIGVGGDVVRSNSSSTSNPRNAGRGEFNTYRFGPQASYVLDVWGANRLAAEGAEDALLASSYGQEVVRLTLIANVANTYFQILSLNNRIDVARRNLGNATKLMELVNAQKRAGKTSSFEVERQKSQVATSEAVIPPLLQQLRVAQDALAILLGKNPQDLKINPPSLFSLAAPEVPLGLPSDLLERRPDIRQAEMNLMAANANIGAARAALFPTLSLNALVGASAGTFGGMTLPGAGYQVVNLGVLATIFDGGKLRGQVDLALARKAELAEVYQQSIVSGFRDVEDALAGIQQFSVEEQHQQDAVAHAREAYRLAELLLRSGATDFSGVLDAERTLLAAETAEDQARLGRFSSLTNLYLALGGGWEAAKNR